MEADKITIRLGQILRTLRKQKGLTLDQLAETTGVSKPMLSQLERGETNPTVVTLWKISTGLHVPFSTFLQELEEPAVTIVRAAEQRIAADDDGRYVVRSITAIKNPQPSDLFLVDLKPDSKHCAEAHGSNITEGIWVKNGQLVIEIGDKCYELKEGDSLHFQANLDHSYINRGTLSCEFLVLLIYSGESALQMP